MSIAIPKYAKISFLIAIMVWLLWLFTLGPERAVETVLANWKISLTMVFGSLVGGGTAEGGGSVAFPILTKVLHVRPIDAKVFALAIQSIGMSAASLVILAMGIKVEWRVIFWATVGGIPGIAIGTGFLAPFLPADVTRMIFTVMVGSFAFALFALNRVEVHRNERIFPLDLQEKSFLVVAGVFGGMLTGLVGTGIDIVVFSLVVLLFRLNEKIATPTTVILQSIVVIVGFVLHCFVLGGVNDTVRSYWLASIPVVVVGAPVGAMICARLSRQVIVRIVLVLISVEVISSLLTIPLRPEVVSISAITLATFSFLYYGMYRNQSYKRLDDARAPNTNA